MVVGRLFQRIVCLNVGVGQFNRLFLIGQPSFEIFFGLGFKSILNNSQDKRGNTSGE